MSTSGIPTLTYLNISLTKCQKYVHFIFFCQHNFYKMSKICVSSQIAPCIIGITSRTRLSSLDPPPSNVLHCVHWQRDPSSINSPVIMLLQIRVNSNFASRNSPSNMYYIISVLLLLCELE